MNEGLSKKEKLQIREKCYVAMIASLDKEYFRIRAIRQKQLMKCQQQLIKLAEKDKK